MAVENVRLFSRIVENDPDIQKKLEATSDPKNLITLCLEVGSERGFTFTFDEVVEYYAEERRKVQESIPAIKALAFFSIAEDRNACYGLPFLARQLCSLELNH